MTKNNNYKVCLGDKMVICHYNNSVMDINEYIKYANMIFSSCFIELEDGETEFAPIMKDIAIYSVLIEKFTDLFEVTGDNTIETLSIVYQDEEFLKQLYSRYKVVFDRLSQAVDVMFKREEQNNINKAAELYDGVKGFINKISTQMDIPENIDISKLADSIDRIAGATPENLISAFGAKTKTNNKEEKPIEEIKTPKKATRTKKKQA